MLKNLPLLILALFIYFGFNSCSRIKEKSQKTADQTKNKLAEKKADFVDKFLPKFDSNNPDTKFNKKRFRDFFGFNPTPDVKEIYCYADEFGIDHKYQFSFICDTSTLFKIITKLNLSKANQPDNFSRELWNNFSWWDSTTITNIKPYFKMGDHETYVYLWYDQKKSKAYYFSFDL